jgi:CheY-like chemotaxis protein
MRPDTRDPMPGREWPDDVDATQLTQTAVLIVEDHTLAAGFDGYWLKPFPPQRLVNIITARLARLALTWPVS